MGEGKGRMDVGDESGVVVEADSSARACEQTKKRKGNKNSGLQ